MKYEKAIDTGKSARGPTLKDPILIADSHNTHSVRIVDLGKGRKGIKINYMGGKSVTYLLKSDSPHEG